MANKVHIIPRGKCSRKLLAVIAGAAALVFAGAAHAEPIITTTPASYLASITPNFAVDVGIVRSATRTGLATLYGVRSAESPGMRGDK
jgi:hypothetical protein